MGATIGDKYYTDDELTEMGLRTRGSGSGIDPDYEAHPERHEQTPQNAADAHQYGAQMLASVQAQIAAGTREASELAFYQRVAKDVVSWDRQMREGPGGGSYDVTDLHGVIRNLSYTGQESGTGLPYERTDAEALIKEAQDRNVQQMRSGGPREGVESDRPASRMEAGYDTSLPDDPAARQVELDRRAAARATAAGGTPTAGGVGGSPYLTPDEARGAGVPWAPRGAPAGAPPPGGVPGAAPPGGVPGAAPYGWGTQYGVGAPPYGGPQSLMGPWTGVAPPTPQMGASTWDPYAAPAPYVPPSAYQPGVYQAPTYAPGAPFTGPTPEQMAADPGYQFRLQQGQEALERSGAARGVTNTGGTLKNILDYGQQAASQEYGNVYNRAAGAWGMNEAARQAAFGLNAPQQFQGWAATEAGRLGAYQMGEASQAGAYGMNEANRAAAAQYNRLGYQQAWQNEAGRRQQQYANQYGQWIDQYNQWRQQGSDRFNEQWMLANA